MASHIFIVILYLVVSIDPEVDAYRNCFDDCHFIQSFDAPFILSDKCNKTHEDFLCQLDITIDYTANTFKIKFGSTNDERKRSTRMLTSGYDYVEETTKINKTEVKTHVFYSCTLQDKCEGDFLLKSLPKLLKRDYMKLQNILIDTLLGPESSSLICSAGLKGDSVSCNGTCAGDRSQMLALTTGKPVFTYGWPSCQSEKTPTSVYISAAKIPMNNRTMLSREIGFECSTNLCNSQEMTDRIEDIFNKNYIAFYQE